MITHLVWTGYGLKPEPVFNAMKDLQRTDQTRVILMCPQGRPFHKKLHKN